MDRLFFPTCGRCVRATTGGTAPRGQSGVQEIRYYCVSVVFWIDEIPTCTQVHCTVIFICNPSLQVVQLREGLNWIPKSPVTSGFSSIGWWIFCHLSSFNTNCVSSWERFELLHQGRWAGNSVNLKKKRKFHDVPCVLNASICMC